MELPLFPLHAVLCPGVALPLHIFEERYRLLINRCIEGTQPFGVVLIREGRETGSFGGRIADVGTTAIIRQVTKFEDGRMNIMTVGGRRFRVDSVAEQREPYLIGDVRLLDEPVGDEAEAARLARRVSQRFLRYLELLQPAMTDEDGPEIEVEIEVEGADEPAGGHDATRGETPLDLGARTEAERHELLMAAARRLAVPDDPTALSYILGGLVHVELPARQALLEAADAESRLRELDSLLWREIQLLGRRLKPLAIDPTASALRRN